MRVSYNNCSQKICCVRKSYVSVRNVQHVSGGVSEKVGAWFQLLWMRLAAEFSLIT